jgi:hypothetical protein
MADGRYGCERMKTRVTRTPGRARPAILWGVAVFVALQLGLALAIELWLPGLGDPECACKMERLRRRAGPGLTVVMAGSSRTMYGFRAGLLEKYLTRQTHGPVRVANFGMLGAGPVAELLVLKRLLAAGHRPDLLLIEVLPPALAGQVPLPFEERSLAVTRVRLAELAGLARLHFLADRLYPWSLAAWPVPCFTHRFNLLSRVVPGWLAYEVRTDRFEICDAWGWSVLAARPRTSMEHIRAVAWNRELFMPYLTGFRSGGPSCRALGELLEVCRHSGVPAALVLMPEATACRGWYPPGVWEEVAGYMAGLGRAYGVPLINAREWVADADFGDPHHLLPSGASVFTRRLGPDVLAVLRDRLPGRATPTETGGGPTASPR